MKYINMLIALYRSHFNRTKVAPMDAEPVVVENSYDEIIDDVPQLPTQED